MKKLLLKNTLIYGTGNASNALIAIFLMPVLTRVFTPAQYGIIELISVTILILSTIAGLNLDSSILRFFHEAELEERITIISTVIKSSIVSSFVFTILAAGFFYFVRFKIFSETVAQESLYLAIFSLPFIVFFSNCLAVLMIKQKAVNFASLSLLKTLLIFLLTVFLIKFYPMGIKCVFLSNLIIHIFLSIACAIYIRKYLVFSFSFTVIIKSLQYSYPLIISSLAIVLLANANKLFLQYFHGPASVGVYSIGLEITMCLNIIGAAFRQAWIPYAFSIIDKGNASEIYRKVFGYFVSGFFIISFLFLISAKTIILILVSNKFIGANAVIGYLTMGILFVNLGGGFFNLGIHIKKETTYSAFAYCIGLIVSIIFNVLLIPKYSIVGASVSLLGGYLATAFSLLYFSNRVYKIEFNLKLLAIIFLSFLMLVIVWTNKTS